MADTSRKRSRKTKLVPRECAVEEDDLELQVPEPKVPKTINQPTNREPTNNVIEKPPEPTFSKPEEVDTSVLKKINAAAREDNEPQTKISPRKFEINIEIESCDDDDEFEGIIDENRLSPNVKDKTEARTEPFELSREVILDAAENILQDSTNVADKILNIYVRNTIGYEEKWKLEQEWYEMRIQQALDEWRTWQFRSFHRESPLFYKCYICTRSWWHLTDFRNHLSSKHTNDLLVIIALEKYEMHEANLIAYHQRLVVVKDIYTEGLCYRCGKDYGAHEIESRFQEKYYRNAGCTKQFFSCMGLRDHFSSCPVCKNEDKPFKCDICKSRFNTKEELNSHLVLSHSVRSDIPIMSHYKTCKRCSQRYSCQYLHKCGQKGPYSECPHCLQSFLNVKSLEIHMERSSKPYKCEVCRAVMAYNCKKYEHMLKHTDKYMIVQKCVTCEGLNVFLNNKDAVAHWMLNHEFKETKRQSYFPKILVPSSCIYETLAESEGDEEESVLEDQVSVLGEQESELKAAELVSEEQESVREEKESVLEEQESVREEKESVLEEQESVWEEKESELEEQELVLEGTESIPEEEEPVPEEESVLKSERESVSVCEQKLLQAELESTRDFLLGNVVVKEEPEDSPRLTIKEEPLEEFENQMNEEENRTENFEHEISVKEEFIEEEYVEEEEEEYVVEEEEEEYEEDIIKLHFNIEDLLVKQESVQEDADYTVEQTEENQESENDDTNEFPQELNEDSMLRPQVIIEGNNRKNKKLYRCSKCGFTARHKQYKNHIDYDCGKTPIKHKTYTCTKCKNTFVSMKKYLTHFKEHGYKNLSCPDCLKEFDTYTHLGQHLQQHIKQNFVRVRMITHAGKAMIKPDFQCKKCGQTTAFQNFFEHWELHINAQPTHPIKVTSRSMHKHSELHETIIKECLARLTKQPKECNHCHRWFKRVNECKRHIIEHLLNDAYSQKHIYKELRCQVCEQGFAVPEKYKQHMRDHASLPVYKCELCDRTFSDSSNFTKHKKVHNLKVIICDLCGKKFQSKASLEKHIEKHMDSQPITCKICNKLFYFDTSYRRHVRYFHEKTVIGYRCVMCGERFESLKFKWNHMWEVHKERKQKADCPICHESFRKYSDVRLHARVHHMKEVSVLTVKKQATKSNIGIDKYIGDPAKIKTGRMETLVVYDSDS